MTHQISIKGPFWTAEATVVDIDGGSRTVFLSRTTQGGADGLSPGTKTVLCRVKKVTIHPRGEARMPTYVWRRSNIGVSTDFQNQAQPQDLLNLGTLSHLVLQVDPDASAEWKYICVNGEINLDPLDPEKVGSSNALDKLYKALPIDQPKQNELDKLDDRTGSAALPGAVTVHASGVSIYGRVQLPWQELNQGIFAPFQIARVFPDPTTDGKPGGFRVAPEHERLSAQESEDISAAWMELSRMLNPRFPLNNPPLAGSLSTPRWVTLEISNPWRVPRIYWQTDKWDKLGGEELPLLYERGEFTLLISDQQAYDTSTPPTSLARFLPETVSVQRTANGNSGDLKISINRAKGGAAQSAQLQYKAHFQNGQWSENLTLTDQELAFDPVDTPRRLRQYQNLPVPEWARTPIEPALLWAFVPLADGWAQLPVPNLTEQIYLDAELAKSPPETVEAHSALRGAVAWGNDQRPVLDAHPGESPWNIALTGAQDLSGTWTLKRKILDNISLQIFEPAVVINGLLWLSKGKPRSVDALPDLDDWVAGLASVPLSTIDLKRDVFQPLITVPGFALTLSTRSAAGNVPGSARLSHWSLEYAADSMFLKNLVAENILPADVFSRWPALIWRRHPSLPMIQALPLTQSQVPPNYPSASRQLVPFALPTTKEKVNKKGEVAFARPDKWIFTVQSENGAATWPILDHSAASPILPDSAWQTEYDLPLVALTLPGIVLDPKSPKITTAPGLDDEPNLTGLKLKYRFDLPYTDEIQALAQLSQATEDGATAPDAEPKPLTREMLAKHWRQLAEKANMAGADAVAAFDRDGDRIVLRHLVEPFDWPVATFFDLSTYPGRFELKNAGGTSTSGLTFDKENALEGISGRFKKNDDGALELLEPDRVGGDYQITAGSMAALVDTQHGFRDQRGLQRGLSQKKASMIKTPVQLDEAGGAQVPYPYDLVSLTAAHKLKLHAGVEWDLWFRDLPIANGTFDRDKVQSIQVEDVNDPQALARARNYLNGYEWRLAQDGHADHLMLFNLHFYPLSLQAVELDEDQVSVVEITGRLQLPLADSGELTDFSNAVRLTFKIGAGGILELKRIAPHLPEARGDWPLSLDEGESGKAPHLLWDDIQLDTNELKIVAPLLKFVLFDTIWTVKLADLSFPSNPSRVSSRHQFDRDLATPTLDPLQPEEVELILDLNPATYRHTVTLDLQIALGQEKGQKLVPFRSRVRFPILAAQEGVQGIKWMDGMLFADRELTAKSSFKGGLDLKPPQMPDVPADPTILLNSNALELRWTTYHNPNHNMQFLPGMPLQGTAVSHNEPGFACLTFEVKPGEGGIHRLNLKTAYVEALLACRWPESVTPDRIFDSSAGELSIGYTLSYTNEGWLPSVLLNGHLEVTNLISWPLAMAEDPQTAQTGRFKLPAVTEASDFQHIRHRIRILFNQQTVLPDVLVIAGSEDVLYTIGEDKSWQFLAVVEHRLIDVSLERTNKTSNDRRWTAVQEVRLLPHKAFDAFLGTLSKAGSPAGEVEYFGTLKPALRNLLVAEIGKLDGTSAESNLLFVEAGAPHWIRQDKIEDAAPIPLQYLPGGTQLGILSGPEDYAPSDPKAPNPKWLLMTMPFLGRLQDDGAEDRKDSFLGDPVSQVKSQRASASELALAFTGWRADKWRADNEIFFTVSALDMPAGRSWPRLDPGALEESWFRLQHPRDEKPAETLQSVTAARPNTPARLSRAMALRHASYAFRPSYPPAPLPPADEMGAALGSRNNLPALQGVIRYEDGRGVYSLWDPSEPPGNLAKKNGKRVELGMKFRSEVDGYITGLRFYKAKRLTGEHTGHLYRGDHGKDKDKLASATFANETSSGWQTVTFSEPAPIKAKPTDIASKEKPTYIASYEAHTGSFTATDDYFGKNWPISNGPLRVYGKNGVFRYSPQSPFEPNKKKRNYWVDVIFLPAPIPAWHLSGAQILSGALGETQTGHTPRRYAAATLHPRPQEATGTARSATSNSITLDAKTGSGAKNAYKGVQIEIISGPGVGQVRVITSYAGDSKVATVDTEWSKRKRPRKESRYRIGAWPLSLAVSPYLGLDFRSSGDQLRLKLISAELICQDRATGALRPVASQMWEAGESDTRLSLNPHIQRWASETHRRLCPESPVAILRFREIKISEDQVPEWVNKIQNPKIIDQEIMGREAFVELLERIIGADLATDDTEKVLEFTTIQPHAPAFDADLQDIYTLSQEGYKRLFDAQKKAPLTTTYGFALVAGIQVGDPLVKQTFALRSAVSQLRFREGKFGGFTIPALAEPFEIAPPQINGVQPLYLTPGKQGVAKDWPWGLSTLRMSVQVTKGGQAVIGTAATGTSSTATLWWQTLQHFVQFRQAGNGNGQPPGAGLPALFRARAIKSLLPVLPNPPMPTLQAATIFNTGGDIYERWQPILPGALRYMSTGARAGVMFAMRHAIIRQSGLDLDRATPQSGAIMVSGSVPVQHRFPRPVPLPDNSDDKKDKALQTWASYFQPTQTLVSSATPVDEAFFAGDAQEQAHRLQLQLIEPQAIEADWDGELRLRATSEAAKYDTQKWDIKLSIDDTQTSIDYLDHSNGGTGSPNGDPQQYHFYHFSFGENEKRKSMLRQLLASKAPGDLLFVRASVKRTPDDGFAQTLSFPLRVIDSQALRLPLAPRFIHFEDPEYNRQLVSTAAQAAQPVVETITLDNSTTEREHLITLAADRKEYNPDSVLAFRFDWADTVTWATDKNDKKIGKGSASYSLKAIDRTGSVRIVRIENPTISDGYLKRHSLLNLKLQDGRPLSLRPGDALEIELTLKPAAPFKPDNVVISLKLDIVSEAVTPVSSSAYALLRRQGIAEPALVECVRFAWGPNASRVELVNPADLRTGVVRRRAVFQWIDSVRPRLKKIQEDLPVEGDDSLYSYAIQKISPNGSTHVPTLGPSLSIPE